MSGLVGSVGSSGSPVGSGSAALRVSLSAFALFVVGSPFAPAAVSSFPGGLLLGCFSSFAFVRSAVRSARAVGLPVRVVLWARAAGAVGVGRVSVLVGAVPCAGWPAPCGGFLRVWGAR